MTTALLPVVNTYLPNVFFLKAPIIFCLIQQSRLTLKSILSHNNQVEVILLKSDQNKKDSEWLLWIIITMKISVVVVNLCISDLP